MTRSGGRGVSTAEGQLDNQAQASNLRICQFLKDKSDSNTEISHPGVILMLGRFYSEPKHPAPPYDIFVGAPGTSTWKGPGADWLGALRSWK